MTAATNSDEQWLLERRMFPKVGHTLGVADLPSTPDIHPNLPMAVSLLNFFAVDGRVSLPDWEQGVSTLGMDSLNDPELWSALVGLFDPEATGAVQLSRVKMLLPVDPMVGALLGALVRTVVEVSRKVGGVQRKAQAQAEMAQSRTVLSVRKRILQPLLARWQVYVMQQRRLRRFGKRLRHREGWRAWQHWRDLAATAARARILARRLLHSDILRALNRWCEVVDEARRVRRVLGRGLTHQRVSRAFETWTGMVQEAASTLNRVRRFAVRFVSRSLYQALATWTAVAIVWRRLSVVARRALHNEEVRAFNCWLAMSEERRRLQRYARRALNGGLGRAWLRWLEAADKGRAVRRPVWRLTQRGLTLAWNAWVEHRERRRRFLSVAGRIVHHGLGRAWRGWCDLLISVGRQARAAQRWLLGSQLRAFNRWVAVADERRRLQRCAYRVLGDGVGRAWLRWLEAAGEYRLLCGAGVRLSQRGLTSAWNTWVAMAASRAFTSSRGGLASGAASRLAGSALGRAMSTWHEVVNAVQRVRGAAVRLVHTSLSQAVNTWIEATAAAHRARRKANQMRRFASRLFLRELSDAWDVWASRIVERERGRRLLLRVVKRGCIAALIHWQAVVQQMRRLRRFLRRLLSRELSHALDHWRQAAHDGLHASGVRLRAMQLLHQGLLVRVYRAWSALAQRGVIVRHRACHALNLLLHRAVCNTVVKPILCLPPLFSSTTRVVQVQAAVIALRENEPQRYSSQPWMTAGRTHRLTDDACLSRMARHCA